MNEPRRLFVAIALPPAVREALAGLCSGLPGMRWRNPETFHLTLCFIGKSDADRYEAIDHALASVAARARTFPVVFKGLGVFGQRDLARILWAGVDPHPGLLSLQTSIAEALEKAAALPREPRPYHPHVSLAKPKDMPRARLKEYLDRHGGFAPPPFTANRLVLYSSHPGPGGTRYEKESEYEILP